MLESVNYPFAFTAPFPDDLGCSVILKLELQNWTWECGSMYFSPSELSISKRTWNSGGCIYCMYQILGFQSLHIYRLSRHYLLYEASEVPSTHWWSNRFNISALAVSTGHHFFSLSVYSANSSAVSNLTQSWCRIFPASCPSCTASNRRY